ncbi:MAG: sugar ABC transporter substrate-binding protein [Chloroflexi bacterium]|nr:sugar ABC transporter substrate-binding protein [Chloroflexota bacterium]
MKRSRTSMLKTVTLIVVVFAVAALLAACGGGSAEPEPAQPPAVEEPAEAPAEEPVAAELPEVCQGQDGTGLKAAFGNLGESVPFAVSVREGIEAVAAECNLEILNADNALDPQIAIDNSRLFMTQEADGIIQFNVHGNIADSICEIVGDTPMIAIDIAHPNCSVFMGANNRQAGEIGGEAAGKVAKEKWDCQIDAIVTHEAPGVGQVNIDRLNGLIAGVQSVCPDVDYGDFEDWSMEGTDLITRLDSDRVDPGFTQGRDWLTANQDKEHIVSLCINDDSCLGMLAAVQESGRDDQVIFASQGADSSVWSEIRTNPMYAGSTAYFPEFYGRYLVPNIIRMINGEAVEDPILIEHLAITADTIDDYYPGDGSPAPEPSEDVAEAPAEDDVCQGLDGGGIKVGFGNLGESVPFAVSVREGIEEVAAECNVQIVNADNALDPQLAVDNSRLFMTQETDGIIQFNVHGNIADSICEIVGDTPMIAIDIAHPNCSVFMGANNRQAGEIGGEAAGAVAKEVWDCQIDAIVTHEAPGVGQVNIDRLNGLIAGVQSVCPDVDYGDFENWSMDGTDLITRLDSDRVDPGFTQGRDWLTANQDKEHIVSLCINDDSCLGMLAAVQEAGRDDQVIFASQGADSSVWSEIRTNPMYAGSTAYFPEFYGRYLIPNIIRMVNGEAVEDPILIEHLAITADNIDDYYPEE